MASTKFSLNITAADGVTPKVTSIKVALMELRAYLLRRSSRGHRGADTLQFRTGMTAASGTVTCATVIATNTVTIGGVTFTAVTGAAGANQFDRSGGTDTLVAAALAAAINASVTAGVAGCVTATSSGAVVTITAAQPGKIGNAITLASSGSTVAVSGARLANGAETLTSYTV